MKIIISPAKKMNVDTDTLAPEGMPAFLEEAEQLMEWMRRLSFEEATSIEDAGVNEAYVYIGEEKETKVFGNGMVDPEKVVGCDLSEVGIHEKVKLSLLLEMLEAAGGDFSALKEAAKERAAELISIAHPKFRAELALEYQRRFGEMPNKNPQTQQNVG